MYQIYEITNTISGRKYIGMTKNSLKKRWNTHLWAAKAGKKSPLYSAIRKYSKECFTISLLEEFDTKQDCCNREIELISIGKDLYNLARGGEGGFVVSNIEEWKQKLREKRRGQRPALGMKHTEENKKFFSECAKRRKLLYDVPLPATFKEANTLYGISKTHYYRLRRRAKSNDLS